MKSFALTGVAGFVAPRHLKAIRETGNDLVAANDLSESAGILDHYFTKAKFFLGPLEFEQYLEKYNSIEQLDYFSVCTPNHLHEEHIRLGLRQGADVICEKPLVLEPSALERLESFQKKTGKEIFNVLQLRLHPSIISLKEKMDLKGNTEKSDIDLSYITPRGNWYHKTWKGDISRSGGIATNIGIHFFDMLIWIFGEVKQVIVHLHTEDRAAGFLELERARVRWYLSINDADVPIETKQRGGHSSRSLKVNGETIDFSDGFEDLHTRIYEGILSGNGFRLMESFPSIELAQKIRTEMPVGLKGEFHPLASVLSKS
ncbi:MAG: Gfo/Idh/MocA family protein [Flavisolibacter sp.]